MTALRIATFNVENLTDAADAEAPLAARIDILKPQFARMAADIVCLQEVDARRPAGAKQRALTALDTLLRDTEYADFYTASTVDPNSGAPRDKHNLVILSRWPIREVKQYANDLVAAPADARGFDSLEKMLVPGTELPAPSGVFPRYVEKEAGA